MLGDIIAKVSGEPFASYMQQHLLEPMGMVNSTFMADEVDPDLQVTGYISAEDGSAAAIEIAGDATRPFRPTVSGQTART